MKLTDKEKAGLKEWLGAQAYAAPPEGNTSNFLLEDELNKHLPEALEQILEDRFLAGYEKGRLDAEWEQEQDDQL